MSVHETKIIDGRAIAADVRKKAADEIKALGLNPGLAVILVGDDPASHLYVGLKEKACAEAGIRFEKHLYPADAEENAILASIQELNQRKDIDAILIQLPLPGHIDTDRIIAEMDPKKDVDGFHPETVLIPGLVTGILLLVQSVQPELAGKTLHVISNSRTFAKPIELLFAAKGAQVTNQAVEADILVVAVGKPGTLTKNMVKPGAVVIDVGTTRIGDKVVGDAEDLHGVAGAVTPVPGGVGPITVAMLIRNTVELAKRRAS